MSTTAETIDINDPLYEICGRLGIEPKNTARIEVTPSQVIATVYVLNDEGKKYVEELTNEVATETLTFKVTT